MDLVGSERTKGSKKTVGERWDAVGNAGEGAGSRRHCNRRRSGRSEVVSFKNSCKIAGKRREGRRDRGKVGESREGVVEIEGTEKGPERGPDTELPGFEDARWIMSEDVNIEHLLDVFTSIDTEAASAWDACALFMEHLYWHKNRLVILRPRIEGLPDSHPSKPLCLSQLSQLFASVGNRMECKRLLTHTLKLWRGLGDDLEVANTLRFISDVNRLLGHYKEGIEQATESLEIYKRLDLVLGQARSWQHLGWLLHEDKQLDAAEEAASRVIGLLSDGSDQFTVCHCYNLLGCICHSKGETEKAIDYFETSLRITSSSTWLDHLFWNNYNLAQLFFDIKRFDDAHIHIERARSHAINHSYFLGRAMELQGWFLYKGGRFEEAKSEALRAVDVYEGIGATKDLENCKFLLRDIEEDIKKEMATSGESGFSGELPEPVSPTPSNPLL